MNAFKAYDIRGVYNVDFDGNDVYKIGYFLPELLETNRILIGRDARTSSCEIMEQLTLGINDAGADVYSMGLSTTPMVYWTTASKGFDGSVQITASHNPAEYNGLKISTTNAVPVGYESGLKELEEMISSANITPSPTKGITVDIDIRNEYIDFMKQQRTCIADLKTGIDCSNGMACIIARDVFGSDPLYIYDNLDCTFPNHDPNPLIEKNLESLKNLVLDNELDIGIIFDGDADRVMFIDEKGQFVRPDLIIGLIALHYIDNKPENVLCDIRTSKSVTTYITKLGGHPHVWKVGHAFAKKKLRELDAVFGGELAGHYYFRDFFYCDSGFLACQVVLNVLSMLKKEGLTLSSFIESISLYPNSGEINFTIENKKEAIEALKSEILEREEPVRILDFDGYRIEFSNWWFNVRASNTEPYLRLVVEADTEQLLNSRISDIREVLSRFSS